MVNSNSPTFKFSEKVGFLMGKVIRYTIVAGVILFLGEKFGRSSPVPNPPAC